MIGAGEITKLAAVDFVDARTVERDYILAHTASAIARVSGSRLVLKGGTSLRLAHFSNYRYSADLDYSANEVSPDDAIQLVREGLQVARNVSGCELLLLADGNDKPCIAYVGPLHAKQRTIKLDISYDEKVIDNEVRDAVVGWRDLGEARLDVYSLHEVCAEKLRCVMQRRQCRDVFDLWTLSGTQGQINLVDVWPLFRDKAENKGLSDDDFFAVWGDRQFGYRQAWTSEMPRYVGLNIPEFDSVIRDLNRRVAALSKAVGAQPR